MLALEFILNEKLVSSHLIYLNKFVIKDRLINPISTGKRTSSLHLPKLTSTYIV